jgi:thimet oligopeptidase
VDGDAVALPEPPFWTGCEDGAGFEREQGERLANAQRLIGDLPRAAPTAGEALRRYDDVVFELDGVSSRCSLVENVHPDAALRGAAERASQKAAAAWTALSLNREVYDTLAAISGAGLNAETRHYLTKTLRDFRLAGVDRDVATRARIAQLRQELVEIGQLFARYIREDRRSVAVRDAAELDGLPDDYIKNHPPDATGVITITTAYPDALPVFSYARREPLRRALHLEYNNRAWPKNMDVLDRMLARRGELATLLGFANWADYVTADKMVGSAGAASQFIDGVVSASTAKAAREYDALLARKRKEQADASAIGAWEATYWSEQVRQSDYAFDAQSVRPYFSFARVKDGVLAVSSRLFGVEFRRVADAAVWHPTVECWEMLEGTVVAGRFYLDLFPRPDKYTHAAHFDIRTGVAGRHLPEAALVCNFPEPKDGAPALMEHSEVRTFFHEFGHLLHGLFARRPWAGVSGIRTEHDFVEAPSQMLEEWTWNPVVLQTFARHHETGEPIPEALVLQMKRASEFGKGLGVRRQMALARTSLSYHDRPAAQVDTDVLHREISARYLPYAAAEGTHFQCAFGHLDGYSAVYYTYMWSLVIAKDLFACFDARDLLAPEVARRYRETVLAAGASAPAAELLQRFLGRPFDSRAWEAWIDEGE